MDSITQFALGAVIGQIIGGRRYGIKAWLVGGLLGTIPDLDVFVWPVLHSHSEFDATLFHRSYSHSFFWQTVASFGVAAIARRLWPKLSYRKRRWMVWLGFITHSILDLGTSYGLPIWMPFSMDGASTHHISIIDPLYTVPLLIGLFGSWIGIRRSRGRRALIIWTGVATAYFGLTIATKVYIHHSITNHLPAAATSHMETPELANTILRKVIAQDDQNYYLTRYNVLYDHPRQLTRFTIPKNNHLRPDHSAIDRLYQRRPLTVATTQNDQLIFYTLGMSPVGVEYGAQDNTIMFGRVWDENDQKLRQYRQNDRSTQILQYHRKRLRSSQAAFLETILPWKNAQPSSTWLPQPTNLDTTTLVVD